MPRLSGFEVCRKLRANPATKDLLILMVTALNEASDFERGVQAGNRRLPDQAGQQGRAALPDQEPAAGPPSQEPARPHPGLSGRGRVGQPRRSRDRSSIATNPMSLPRVVVKPRRARPFFARHPWVFVTSIGRVSRASRRRATRWRSFSHERQFIARGLFNPHSAIRVRLYRWDDGPLDEAFWSEPPGRGRPAAARRARARRPRHGPTASSPARGTGSRG